ncbi:MAG: ABC transporter ATP-binding protein, partial [Ferruginibacter sp.]
MHPLLQVEKLDISFTQDEEKTRAVKEISFRLEQGEMMALVGESGSGKSVTALSFLQLLPQQAGISGNIFFSSDGKEQVNLAKAGIPEMEKIRGNKIAMIFQEPMTSLNPVFTCGNQVMESLRLHQHLSKAAARQRTIELFTQVELPDPTAMLTRYPHELSGGQKQRVMIAMAISCNPALLIADEPTTALDVSVQKHILQLVKKLQLKYNMGVLLITHDLGLVAEVADSIAVMYKGELVETGPATQILSNPQNPYTQALLACRPAANSKGHRLPQVADFLSGDEPPRNDLRLPHTAKI